MKLNVKNTTKISAAIDAVEGRAQVNTISAERLQNIATLAEKELAATGLPLAERKSARFEFRDAGPSAKAYSWRQGATHVMIERGSSSWFLISVTRDEIHPQQRGLADLFLTQTQKDAAVRRFAESLRVYRTAVPEQQQPEPLLVSAAA